MASDDYEVNSPESEQELPASAASAGAAIYDIPSEDAEKIERRAQAKKAEQELHLKDNAFSLLCACLVGGAVLYIIDTIVLWNDKASSSILTTILDLDKTVITFLLGYLFAYEKPKK